MVQLKSIVTPRSGYKQIEGGDKKCLKVRQKLGTRENLKKFENLNKFENLKI